MMTFKCIKNIFFYKIKFLDIDTKEFDKLISNKGLFVFPSGPGLATLDKDSVYHKSLVNADYVFFDSGFFVLLLRLLKNIGVEKFSGYKFLNLFFMYLKLHKNKSIFCIDPNINYSNSNKKYLKKLGLKKIHNYVAPFYNTKKLIDKSLISKINKAKPDFIMTNIGGGVQEILGLYLKKNLKNKTTIICTGGAISFFTKDQAPINSFIDQIYLGWFVRLLFNPIIFWKRYLYALKLFPMVLFNKIDVK